MLIQDDEGNWWYYYWGSDSEYIVDVLKPCAIYGITPWLSNTMRPGLNTNLKMYMRKTNLQINGFNTVSLKRINYLIPGLTQKGFSESPHYDKAIYFRGDYTRSYHYAQYLFDNRRDLHYSVLHANCAQTSIGILAMSQTNIFRRFTMFALANMLHPATIHELLSLFGEEIANDE